MRQRWCSLLGTTELQTKQVSCKDVFLNCRNARLLQVHRNPTSHLTTHKKNIFPYFRLWQLELRWVDSELLLQQRRIRKRPVRAQVKTQNIVQLVETNGKRGIEDKEDEPRGSDDPLFLCLQIVLTYNNVKMTIKESAKDMALVRFLKINCGFHFNNITLLQKNLALRIFIVHYL